MASGSDLFLNYCRARSTLYNDFQNRLKDINDEYADISPHSIFDVFEFLYMLAATQINSGEKLALVAKAHNAECERLMTLDPPSLIRLGLNKIKIKDSMFSDKNIRKLNSNYSLGGAIDQSDISRLLFKHMSRETVRKALILFDRAALVSRIDAGDSILIRPNGEAERLFERYLVALTNPNPARTANI